MNRFVVGALALFTVVTLRPAGAAADCRFVAPPDWSSATSIRWFGACPNGSADGLGVLRSYLGAKPGPVFYGRMVLGGMDVGVVEDEGGFTAGRFRDGEIVGMPDRNEIIRAFGIAEKAARATAERFSREGNAGSARYYADRADRLARQMD